MLEIGDINIHMEECAVPITLVQVEADVEGQLDNLTGPRSRRQSRRLYLLPSYSEESASVLEPLVRHCARM